MKRYTIGLMANHPTFKRPTLVKVFMESSEEGVLLTVESAHTLSRLNWLGSVLITREEWENRPFDAYDNIVEARWAFEKFNLSV